MNYAIRLLDKLKLLDTKNVLNFDLIDKAIYWSKIYHVNQFRKSGEPFYSHPVEVAYMVSDYNLKTDVIVASILHDIVEDTKVTVEMIQSTFGSRIAEMVDRLTRNRPDGSKLSVEEILNNAYQKQDEEVLLIKLFDRLHNLTTLDAMTDEKKKKIALETLSSFLTIALSFDEHGDQMIAKLCFNHLQLNYSQPSFSSSNLCKLKPIEFDFIKLSKP